MLFREEVAFPHTLMPEDRSGILSDSLTVHFGVLCNSLLILGIHCNCFCV